jgi:prolyl-tRNA synthetase
MEAIGRLTADWKGRLRFKIDDRDQFSPGYKFNEWELKGVPVRVEIGPKDIEKGTVGVARRDMPGKQGKSFVPQQGLTEHVEGLLATIQQSLYDRALKFREEHTYEASNYEELKERVEKGFVRAYWAGSRQDEEKIQEETGATIRVIPLDQPGTSGKCVYTGKEARKIAVFARAY